MEMTVTSLGGDRDRIAVRGHEFTVDQPLVDGGDDLGPTPVELFVASLASCIAHYGHRALGHEEEQLTVQCSWTMSPTRPWRVRSVAVDVHLPASVSPARFEAVRRAVTHCTVHNSLVDPPLVQIDVHPELPATSTRREVA